MASKHRNTLEFANFICKFGEDINLLDLAEEIVLPAFQDTSFKREYTDTTYFFHDVRVLELQGNDGPVLAVTGRFIKDTIIERNQIFDPALDRLIEDTDSMPSAPSAIFVLILNTHKLIYLRENQGSALLSTFETTCQRFIRDKHESFIRFLQKEMTEDSSEERVTLKSLREKYPRPTVEVIPLATQDSLSRFIQRFETLRNVQIKLVRPNDEVDNDGFFVAARKQGNEIKAKQTTITYQNPEGLDKKEALLQLNAVTEQGNSRIDLSGTEEGGLTLKGNNDRFKAKLPFDSSFQAIPEAAQKMLTAFQGSPLDARVSSGSTHEKNQEKILKIKDGLGLNGNVRSN
jgi:hypothetical protein